MGFDLEASRGAAFVSCDIVAHGDDPDPARQLERIKQLNAAIRDVCAQRFGRDVIWASGGDGGHLALFGDDKIGLAFTLIRKLYAWAKESRLGFDGGEIRLRLTAHYGPVSVIVGADGRNELVGDGINVCGALLKFGKAGIVLATGAFRDLCESGGVPEGVHFHHEQYVYLKHERVVLLMPLSIHDLIASPESVRLYRERPHIDEALGHGRFWAAIYHAKRLLQVDSTDVRAIRALQQIMPSQLVLSLGGGRSEAHPLLSPLNRQAMQDIISAAQLVERKDGDTICVLDDPGDAMFIVLKGAVGVVLKVPPTDEPGGHSAPSSIKLGEGQIVGELALALNRKRTATLQAIGPTAFLSINYSILRALMDAGPQTGRLQTVFNDFLLQRSLRFLCQNCAYLASGVDSPLAGLNDPWESLAEDAERFQLNWQDAEGKLASAERFSAPGAYILAGGALTEATRPENVPKKLDSRDLPLVCVNLPNILVSNNHPFQLDAGPGGAVVNVVRISERSLRVFGPVIFARMVDALKRRLASQFVFDVFISYSSRDDHIASKWRAALDTAGLRVYMSRPDAMRKFKPEIELALAEALVMVPIISENAAAPDGQTGWVQREIEYRKMLFDEDHCNILPIELTRGLAAVFADGFSAVTVDGDSLEQLDKVVETIRAVKEGMKDPPYASQRKARGPI